MFKKIAFCLLVLLNFSAFASECYHYHTSVQYKIETDKKGVFLVCNTIDPNGVSISDSKKVKLALIPQDDWVVESTGGDFILLSNKNAYFILNADSYNFEQNQPLKIFDKNEIISTFNGNMFLKNNEWIHVSYNDLEKKVTRKKITNLPADADLFAKTPTNSYLLKNKQSVYTCVFRNNDVEVLKVPNINAAKARFIAPEYYLDNYILYDNATFYLTDNDTFYLTDTTLDLNNNVTNEFKELGFSGDFTALEHVNNGFLTGFYDVKENTFWSYVEAGISLEDSSDTHFYPIENTQLTSNKMFVVVNGKYYNQSWNAVYETGEINTSNPSFLDKMERFMYDIYYDGSVYYRFNYDSNTFVPIDYLQGTIAFYNGVNSYQHGTPSFFLMQKGLYVFNGENSVKKLTDVNNEIKDLSVGYAFNNQLFIDDELITTSTDFNSIAFAGSLVDVQSPCDGGRGQIPVVVHYYHFFKDKNGLYVYSTERKTIEKVTDENAANSFETMQQWMQKNKKALSHAF